MTRLYIPPELRLEKSLHAYLETIGKRFSESKFRAYRATNQSINGSTATKVQIDTAGIDTNGDMDVTTNYRFTPTVNGNYLINGIVKIADGSGTFNARAMLYKNGVEVARAQGRTTGSGTQLTLTVTDIINMNGLTDYLELYVYHDHGSAKDVIGGTESTYFNGTILL